MIYGYLNLLLIDFIFLAKFQRLQEIDDNLLKVVRGSSGRNPAGVEAEIRELEKELKIPGKFHSGAENAT